MTGDAETSTGPAILLFRSMRSGPSGLPEVGATARTLGVRPGIDIPVGPGDSVRRGTGGMSVSPDRAEHLPRHRRPPERGGTGKDPVWNLRSDQLGRSLTYRPDPANPEAHGFIEPAVQMTLDAYRQALEATRVAWRRVD